MTSSSSTDSFNLTTIGNSMTTRTMAQVGCDTMRFENGKKFHRMTISTLSL